MWWIGCLLIVAGCSAHIEIGRQHDAKSEELKQSIERANAAIVAAVNGLNDRVVKLETVSHPTNAEPVR